ncbi:helix-turn-helix transcriptional regulator [Oscillibacter sp.]|uniref:helix-turn-helix domain-containing protein n=1 Tax=Oscillibacter sp. TaxID=1945593 RepID=UPI00289E8276|nr:helix-turn-helix transcriptional regulator [Oscillibacter sp.]
MVSINKLRGKIVECGLTIENLADMMGINRSTLYRRLNTGGENISIKEANQLKEILQLTPVEANNIFFNSNVASNATRCEVDNTHDFNRY